MVQALKRGPRLPLGQAGRPELQRADLRQPLRRRGQRGLHPHLVARPQAQRRLSRTRQSPARTAGRGLLAHHSPRGRLRKAKKRKRLRAPPNPRRSGFTTFRRPGFADRRPRRARLRLPFATEHRRLPCPGGRGANKEVCSLYLEGCRQPIDYIDAGGINATLKRTDVGSIDIRPVRELFLRQPCCAPISPQVPRENLPNVHAREGSGLSSILPRSILYNSTLTGFMLVRRTQPRGTAIAFAHPLALSQSRRAPALNVTHFIVVTDAISWICILMHEGARGDA